MINPRIPPPIVGIVCAAFIFLIARYDIGPSFSHPASIYLAMVCAVSGLVIELLSVFSFIKFKTTVNPLRPANASTLVTSGMNRFSRNPMYLGMLLLITSLVLYSGYGVAIIAPSIFALYMTYFQIMPEEAALIIRFGDEYDAYMKRVRRWI